MVNDAAEGLNYEECHDDCSYDWVAVERFPLCLVWVNIIHLQKEGKRNLKLTRDTFDRV